MKRTLVSCHGTVEVGGLAQGALVNEQKRRALSRHGGDCVSLIHANGELGQVGSLQWDGSLQAGALLSFHHQSDGSKAERGPELGSTGGVTVKIKWLQD